MPFKATGHGDYTSPSGRHFSQKQVNLYYASDGFNKGKMKAMGFAKGGDVAATRYAAGGPVLGRTREFLKEPDEVRESKEDDNDQDYGKKGKGTPAKGKSLPAVKPRK